MKDDSNYTEKRAFSRYPVSIPVGYLEPYSRTESPAFTHDISEQGLCIVSDRPMLSDSYVDVYLQLFDDGRKIHRRGRVAWTRMIEPGKYYNGVQIEDEPLDSIDLVLRTIKSQRNY
ncbi:MAG: PilZ domain-containing protein [Candidatus Omnitrophica bacterium]|nr:PilZ domain-containing protein [Candidatus Omnitrophota bacterium]